jgi:hypothetical protein
LIASGGSSAKVVRANNRASAKGVFCARAVIKPKVPAASALLSTVRRVGFKPACLKAVVLHFGVHSASLALSGKSSARQRTGLI